MKIDPKRLEAEQPVPGVTRRRVTGGSLELIVYEYEPGTRFPRHAHEAEQLTIVKRGLLVFTFDDEEVRVVEGEAVLIEGGRPHAAHVPAEAETTETFNVFTPVRERLPG